MGTKVNLLGSNAHEIATVDQWVHFADHEILGPVQNITGLVYYTSFYGTFSLEVRTKTTIDAGYISEVLAIDSR